MNVFYSVQNGFDALEDWIPGPDHRYEFLIEHDEIFIFDLLLKRKGRNPDSFPVQFDRKDAISLFFKMFLALIMRRCKHRLREDAPVFSGQSTKKIRHLF